MPQKYPQQFRDRAIRMVTDRLEQDDAPSRYVVTQEIARKLGIAAETLRRWLVAADQASGKAPTVPVDAAEEIRRLKRENAELKRANEILKTASAFFAAELDRPTTK